LSRFENLFGGQTRGGGFRIILSDCVDFQIRNPGCGTGVLVANAAHKNSTAAKTSRAQLSLKPRDEMPSLFG
jgi:hypothetical protein